MNRCTQRSITLIGAGLAATALGGCFASSGSAVATIPDAAHLGPVPVHRSHDVNTTGWQCIGEDETAHINTVDFYVPARQGRGWAKQRIEPAVWSYMLRTFMLERTPDRVWLREALEQIHAAAEAQGMSREAKAEALHHWIVCHVSEDQANAIRRLTLRATRPSAP